MIHPVCHLHVYFLQILEPHLNRITFSVTIFFWFFETSNRKMAPACSRCLSTDIQDLECQNKCKYCHSCIARFIYADYNNGKLEFVCPNTRCNANITMVSLQKVLQQDWKKVVYRRRLLQLNESGHQNLELCPCCNCVAVLDSKKEHFSCLNPKCLKDICVNCKGDAHAGIACKDMGNIRVGLCNKCGNKFFDNNKCVKDSATKMDNEQIMEMVRNSCVPETPSSFFGKFFEFCDTNYETIVLTGLSTIGSYFLIKYLKEKF